MAAGVREMKRPERVAYLQRIVKNLASFKVSASRDLNFRSLPLLKSFGKWLEYFSFIWVFLIY